MSGTVETDSSVIARSVHHVFAPSAGTGNSNVQTMMRPEKSAENKLLALCARPTIDGEAANYIAELVEGISDWPTVIDAAQKHGTLPLLQHHLEFVCAEIVPRAVLLRLRELSEANANHVFRLTGELGRILKLMRESDIHAVSFKGPTLALLAYGDIGLRVFADLDLLIYRKDVSQAERILETNGFKAFPALSSGQLAACFNFDCAQNFRDQQNVTVDVHWAIAPKYFGIDLDLDRLHGGLQPVQIGEKRILTPSQEDLLLVLSIHGFTHNWERLGWISDITGLIERKITNWELLLGNAGRLGLKRIVSVALLLAKELLDAQMPAIVLNQIESDTAAVVLAARYARRILAPARDDGYLQSVLIHLRMRERLSEKISSGIRLLATPRAFDWLSFSAPARLSFFYYLARPVRLAAKQARKLARSGPQRQLQQQPIRRS
jgi:Uncharacterised nucleotidyltransferase